MPVEADESKKNINKINTILKEVETNVGDLDEDNFNTSVKKLADYLNYSISNEHLSKLYETITDNSYHVAFEQEKYKHLAITFHSSKGLEFDQVILFSEDYRLNDISSIYNHYVASSRAKNKLIIVSSNNYNSRCFEDNLKEICTESDVSFSDLFKVQ
ncbi:hypothetical protein F3286_14255 [Listeria monocytogenes]|nr:hypothetical protein [Listeria monocytogenes]